MIDNFYYFWLSIAGYNAAGQYLTVLFQSVHPPFTAHRLPERFNRCNILAMPHYVCVVADCDSASYKTDERIRGWATNGIMLYVQGILLIEIKDQHRLIPTLNYLPTATGGRINSSEEVSTKGRKLNMHHRRPVSAKQPQTGQKPSQSALRKPYQCNPKMRCIK